MCFKPENPPFPISPSSFLRQNTKISQCCQLETQLLAARFRLQCEVTGLFYKRWFCLHGSWTLSKKHFFLKDHANLTTSQSPSKGAWAQTSGLGYRETDAEGPRLGGSPQPWQEKEKDVCVGVGRDTHVLPSILSEEIVLKFTKFLSNPLLFFSHFLKVFQEFWSKREKKMEENRVKSELS